MAEKYWDEVEEEIYRYLNLAMINEHCWKEGILLFKHFIKCYKRDNTYFDEYFTWYNDIRLHRNLNLETIKRIRNFYCNLHNKLNINNKLHRYLYCELMEKIEKSININLEKK